MRLTFDCPEKTYLDVKEIAASKGLSPEELMVEFIEAGLNAPPAAPPDQPPPVRSGQAGGRLKGEKE